MASVGVVIDCDEHLFEATELRRDHRRMSPGAATPDEAPRLFGENAAWLLHL